jgi:ferric-dicitrate binding protein FerR (iron transport regulator)
VPHPRSYGQIVAFVNGNLPLYVAALRKLEALRPSAADRVAFERWLADDRRTAAALRRLGLAGQRHDFPGTTAAVNELQSAALASRADANALGVAGCAAA